MTGVSSCTAPRNWCFTGDLMTGVSQCKVPREFLLFYFTVALIPGVSQCTVPTDYFLFVCLFVCFAANFMTDVCQ